MLPYREPPSLWKLLASILFLATIGGLTLWGCLALLKSILN